MCSIQDTLRSLTRVHRCGNLISGFEPLQTNLRLSFVCLVRVGLEFQELHSLGISAADCESRRVLATNGDWVWACGISQGLQFRLLLEFATEFP